MLVGDTIKDMQINMFAITCCQAQGVVGKLTTSTLPSQGRKEKVSSFVTGEKSLVEINQA